MGFEAGQNKWVYKDSKRRKPDFLNKQDNPVLFVYGSFPLCQQGRINALGFHMG